MVSCDKEGDDDMPKPQPIESNKINFESLEVGQKSIYIRLMGENYYDDSNNNFEYLADTLIVEVTEKTDTGFVFQDYLTPASRSLTEPNWEKRYWDANKVNTYHIAVKDNQISATSLSEEQYGSSHIGYLNDENAALSFTPITENPMTIEGWKVIGPHNESYSEGYAENYSLFGIFYDRLNIVINNVPMQVDGPGTTTVYNKNSGIVRISTYSAWTGEAWGWDLLSE